MLSDWLQQFCTYWGGTLCLVGHALRVHISSQQSLHLSVTLIVSSIVHNSHMPTMSHVLVFLFLLFLLYSPPSLMINHPPDTVLREREKDSNSVLDHTAASIHSSAFLDRLHPSGFFERDNASQEARWESHVLMWNVSTATPTTRAVETHATPALLAGTEKTMR